MGEVFQIVFSPRSLRDLKSIVRFIRPRGGPEVAARCGNQLIDRAMTLTSLPERGRAVPELGLPYREIIFKSYRIIYRIDGEKVFLLRFWHAARGVPEIDSDAFRDQK